MFNYIIDNFCKFCRILNYSIFVYSFYHYKNILFVALIIIKIYPLFISLNNVGN